VRQHLQHVAPQSKPKYRDRGVPPLPTFDIDALADGQGLTEREAAAVLRRSLSCLQNWRQDREHPLKWKRIAGRVLYTAGAIRKYRKAVTTK
jgi:DNA-binding transcriptional regulator YiaG